MLSGQDFTTEEQQAFQALFIYWSWKVLYTLDGQRDFLEDDGFNRNQLADYLGAHQWVKKYNKEKIKAYIEERAKASEKNDNFEALWEKGLPKNLKNNLNHWQEMFSFSETEKKILGFMVLVRNSNLSLLLGLIGALDNHQTYQLLSTLLQLPEHTVRSAFNEDSKLKNLRLLAIDSDGEYYLTHKVEFITGHFPYQMITADFFPETFIREFITSPPKTQLSLADFAYLGDLPQAVKHHLADAFMGRKTGCNILIYGQAGTGKTELSRLFAESASAEIYEISWADKSGDAHDRNERLKALQMAQRVLETRHNYTVLLFDEMEDIFDRTQDEFILNKAWLNRFLENNPVPMIWVCNQIELLDPSFIRRFDVVIRCDVPPLKVRKKILKNYAGELLNQKQINDLAENQFIAPAILERAQKVVSHTILDSEQYGQLYQKLVENTLEAQGYPKKSASKTPLPEHYRPEWINCITDLNALAEGLIQRGRGNLCFYGASGTGKSAFGAWLAHRAEKPLIYKRASDLLGKYVGETEQNIARAFEEALENEAVLIFDEVDSFLQDRRQAHHSWEVSQVNEMLVQMEQFKGIFIASTNLVKHLDLASLRRFDFKLEFKPLKPEQAWAVFQHHCQLLNLNAEEALHHEIIRLPQLTLGDFALVLRQAKILPFAHARAFLEALLKEHELKEGAKRPIGFV